MSSSRFWGDVKDLWRAAVNPQASAAEIFKLVRERQFQEALQQLEASPGLWASTHDGNTLLHWASLGGSPPLVSGALRAGTHVDARSPNQQTPLMWAVLGGHVEVVHTLLEARAELGAQDVKGATPAILAVQHGQHPALQLLINQDNKDLNEGRDVGRALEKADTNRCTAAHWAAFLGDLRSLELLDAAALDFRTADVRGSLPLHCAVSAHQLPVIGFLVERGCSPTVPDADGFDCLHIAEKLRNSRMQGELLAAMLRRLLRHQIGSGCSPKPQPGSGDASPAGGRDPRAFAVLPPLGVGALALLRCSPELEPSELPAASLASVALAAAAGAADAGAGGVPSSSSAEAEQCAPTLTGISFHLSYAGSWDALLRSLIKNLKEACAPGREPLAIAFVVTDRYERVVDVSSPSTTVPSLDHFPLRVEVVGESDAPAEECSRWLTQYATPWTPRTSASPECFSQRTLLRTPASFRWEAWKIMLRLRDRDVPRGDKYRELSEQRSEEYDQLIAADVVRTFRICSEEEHASLRRILRAYVAWEKEEKAGGEAEVGYTQGMNLIACLLLLISNCEEEAFGVFVCLMRDIGLAGFFRDGFPLLGTYSRLCSRLLADLDPELSRHFSAEGSAEPGVADCSMYVQKWFLTLFIDCMPLSVVVIIWDAILCEGLHVVLKIALTLLRGLRGQLLCMDMHDMVRYIQSMQNYNDEDGDLKAFEVGLQLVRAAQEVTLPEISTEDQA